MADTDHIVDLLQRRRQARIAKDWKSSDQLRNELDDLGIFLFDRKDGDYDVLLRKEGFFIHMHRAGVLNGIEFKNRRHYVEWRLQQDILAEKRFDAWLYSMCQSEGYQRSRQKDE